jgi:outer membrane protein assembly factor BamB
MSIKNRHMALPLSALICAILLVSAPSSQSQSNVSPSGQWPIAGQNLSNTWSQPEEHSISPTNVNGLRQKWVFTTGGDVTATPTVDGDAVYFPDWAGNLFAVEKESGKLIWSHKISDYDGVAGAISRVSPAVEGNQVIIGDILNSKKVHNGANVISVDRETGTIRWMTQVDTHPAAVITGSPVVFDGVVYLGVSSNEEGLAADPAYPCCSFRGSVVALDVKTGAMLWKTFDVPDNGGKPGGYSGGAVWQPPAIDPRRGTLFVGTGNNYTAPADVEACQNATPTANCAAADDFFDAALALDLKTGQIKWAKRLQGLDTWTLACFLPTGTNPNCPIWEGQAPTLWTILSALARRAASIGHSIPITATSFGAHRWGQALRSEASSGVQRPMDSAFMLLSRIAIISPTPWCRRVSRSRGDRGALLTLTPETSFGRRRIPPQGPLIPAR